MKKYSSTVATIFTGLASAALFGHALTINFVLGVTIVFISMHQVWLTFSETIDALVEVISGSAASLSKRLQDLLLAVIETLGLLILSGTSGFLPVLKLNFLRHFIAVFFFCFKASSGRDELLAFGADGTKP